jgi:hypothetical protein
MEQLEARPDKGKALSVSAKLTLGWFQRHQNFAEDIRLIDPILKKFPRTKLWLTNPLPYSPHGLHADFPTPNSLPTPQHVHVHDVACAHEHDPNISAMRSNNTTALHIVVFHIPNTAVYRSSAMELALSPRLRASQQPQTRHH